MCLVQRYVQNTNTASLAVACILIASELITNTPMRLLASVMIVFTLCNADVAQETVCIFTFLQTKCKQDSFHMFVRFNVFDF